METSHSTRVSIYRPLFENVGEYSAALRTTGSLVDFLELRNYFSDNPNDTSASATYTLRWTETDWFRTDYLLGVGEKGDEMMRRHQAGQSGF
jgi:hypothetical protein